MRRALRAALALQDAPQSMFERLLLRGYRLDLARGLRAARPAIAPEAHDALGRLANWLEASKVEAPELIVAVQDVLELLEECGRDPSDERPAALVGQ